MTTSYARQIFFGFHVEKANRRVMRRMSDANAIPSVRRERFPPETHMLAATEPLPSAPGKQAAQVSENEKARRSALRKANAQAKAQKEADASAEAKAEAESVRLERDRKGQAELLKAEAELITARNSPQFESGHSGGRGGSGRNGDDLRYGLSPPWNSDGPDSAHRGLR